MRECVRTQGIAWLPHFPVQPLNINKGQLETSEMSGVVPDLDHGFSFLFLSMSQRSNNHLQECGMFQCVHFTWSCTDGVSALIPPNFVFPGVICCLVFFEKQ